MDRLRLPAPLHIDSGWNAEVAEGRGQDLGGGVASPGAESAQCPVDLPGAILSA